MPKKFLAVIATYFLSQLVFAHGGGLNSDGCHNEKKTGGYHCHRSTSSKAKTATRSNTLIYNRSDFQYRSYTSSTSVGFYTKQVCSAVNIDHVVSLKDAHESGASAWSSKKKVRFGNDRDNHVPSCRQVNISKGSVGPADFLRRSQDGKGADYRLVRFCDYVAKYHAVKTKYALSFASNSKQVFADCRITI